MKAAFLAAIVASGLGASDALVKLDAPGMSLMVPSAWKASAEGDSKMWEEPGGDEATRAKLELTMWSIEKRDPNLCVKQVADQLSKDAVQALPDGGTVGTPPKFDTFMVGGFPVIRNVAFDYVSNSGVKSDKNKVSTVTVVGCNGTTRWLLTMTSPATKAPRFGALLKKIVDSVQYDGK